MMSLISDKGKFKIFISLILSSEKRKSKEEAGIFIGWPVASNDK